MKFAALFLSLCMAVGAAWADEPDASFSDGKTMAQECKAALDKLRESGAESDRTDVGTCSIYIMGVIDAIRMADQYVAGGVRICMPKLIRPDLLISDGVESGRAMEREGVKAYTYTQVIGLAIARTYPCSE